MTYMGIESRRPSAETSASIGGTLPVDLHEEYFEAVNTYTAITRQFLARELSESDYVNKTTASRKLFQRVFMKSHKGTDDAARAANEVIDLIGMEQAAIRDRQTSEHQGMRY